jgi:hypothetical protein
MRPSGLRSSRFFDQCDRRSGYSRIFILDASPYRRRRRYFVLYQVSSAQERSWQTGARNPFSCGIEIYLLMWLEVEPQS